MSDPQRDHAAERAQMGAAEKARDVLAAQFLNDPAVSLIDIGLGAATAGQATGGGAHLFAQPSANPAQSLVLRLHVRSEAAKQQIQAPAEINGFPVRVMVGDYKLE